MRSGEGTHWTGRGSGWGGISTGRRCWLAQLARRRQLRLAGAALLAGWQGRPHKCLVVPTKRRPAPGWGLSRGRAGQEGGGGVRCWLAQARRLWGSFGGLHPHKCWRCRRNAERYRAGVCAAEGHNRLRGGGAGWRRHGSCKGVFGTHLKICAHRLPAEGGGAPGWGPRQYKGTPRWSERVRIHDFDMHTQEGQKNIQKMGGGGSGAEDDNQASSGGFSGLCGRCLGPFQEGFVGPSGDSRPPTTHRTWGKPHWRSLSFIREHLLKLERYRED